jgi:hypothetical protein
MPPSNCGGSVFLLSLKELKDGGPESSRTKKVCIAKQKERLLESKKEGPEPVVH